MSPPELLTAEVLLSTVFYGEKESKRLHINEQPHHHPVVPRDVTADHSGELAIFSAATSAEERSHALHSPVMLQHAILPPSRTPCIHPSLG